MLVFWVIPLFWAQVCIPLDYHFIGSFCCNLNLWVENSPFLLVDLLHYLELLWSIPGKSHGWQSFVCQVSSDFGTVWDIFFYWAKYIIPCEIIPIDSGLLRLFDLSQSLWETQSQFLLNKNVCFFSLSSLETRPFLMFQLSIKFLACFLHFEFYWLIPFFAELVFIVVRGKTCS
jgi:hypothetical protein